MTHALPVLRLLPITEHLCVQIRFLATVICTERKSFQTDWESFEEEGQDEPDS